MSDRFLISAFGTSLLVHLGLLPLMALLLHARPAVPVMVPIDLIDVPSVQANRQPEITPAPPQAKPKAAKITAPKLLSKPTIIDNPAIAAADNPKEEIKQPERPRDEPPKPTAPAESPGAVKAGSNVGNKSAEAEGSAAGAGNLFGKGDVAVVGGSGVEGGGGGRGVSGLGRGTKGDGTGGSDALAGLARPLGGYQVRPRYPESARRAGVQGTTLLKLRVLENGRVGDVVIEQSAGHRDLDHAAADAVKKWLFEPARMGQQPIAVWVLLPVRFELQR